tara:strand:+ start:637 stop:1347 length:711 start_codon:yes stop_codon:yes gene_type:complete
MSKTKEVDTVLPVEKISSEEKAEQMEKEQRLKNLEFWNSVEKTDPSFTKQVDFGRGFTSIDAHYQIREATAKWGLLGSGWGVDAVTVSDPNIIDPSLVGMSVTIWYKDEDGNKCYGVPILATSQKHFGKKADDDAFKKATTDGITKGLSYFGFNADVFLGKFDDNKYVKEVTEHFKEPADTMDLSDSKKAIREAFSKDEKWEASILDWAKVDDVDKMTNPQIIEVMKMITPKGGEK